MKTVGIIAAICAVVGISAAFLLISTDSSTQILDNNQEVSQISISNTFSEPVKISQSIDEAQPAPNIAISDDGKIYVEYDDYTVPKDPEGKIGGPYLKGDYLQIIDVATITR